MSKRKRAPPTPEEVEAKKTRLMQIKVNQVALVNLRHKIVALWEFGMHTDNLQFPPKSSKKIIEFLQQNYPRYAHFNAAKSFFWRTIKKHREGLTTPHLEAHRDRRGENRRSTKRKCALNITLVDELLSEPKATAPKVKRALFNRGINLSVATIQRIAKDLRYRWTKPWYTDILTPAQKYKRKLFAEKLLQLSEEHLLRHISEWLFTDEKWWDLVGPGCAEYIKADTDADAKKQNQV